MHNDPAARPTTIHLVPHTHWDREWYRPFQSFRMQLVELVDRVLEMLEAEPEFAFTLDGQLATVDDYLEIRPDQAERIRGHVMSGRLAIGPWQILMDEFLVSGETLVRNLERGWRRAEDFGGPMRVGYLPDMFGHVAQMPQILRRAGLADAVVWRGVPAAVDRHAFRWESPDGSWVRAEYLPIGYGNAVGMFAVPEALDAAADRLLEWAEPWYDGHPVLAMYGTDHAAPVPELAALVSRLNEVHEASAMGISTLAGYLDAAPPLTPDDPCWRGEMRSGARANVLMGVASARIDIKQAAGRAETLLERYAEPLTALHVAQEAWPAPFLDLAWGKVIENSAHDSICGCSIDPVVDQVLVRFAEAEQIASSIARRAGTAVAATVERGAVAVLNPTPAPRTGLVEAELLIPEAWADVALELPNGTRVATQELGRKDAVLFDEELRGDQVDELFRRFHGREVFDHAWNGYTVDGRTITLLVDRDPDPLWLDVDGLRAEVMATMRAAPADSWQVKILASPRRTVAASVPVPALGWTAVRPVEGPGEVADGVRAAPDGRTLSNGLVSVAVDDAGTIRLTAADGPTLEGRRPHRGRRGLRRQLQLRSAGGRSSRLGALVGERSAGASRTRAGPAARRANLRLARRRDSRRHRPDRGGRADRGRDRGRAPGRRAVRARGRVVRQSLERPPRPLPCPAAHDARTGRMRRASSRSSSVAPPARVATTRSPSPPIRPMDGSTPAGSPSCSTTSPSTSSPRTAPSSPSRSCVPSASSAATTTRTGRIPLGPRSRPRTRRCAGVTG